MTPKMMFDFIIDSESIMLISLKVYLFLEAHKLFHILLSLVSISSLLPPSIGKLFTLPLSHFFISLAQFFEFYFNFYYYIY